MKWTGEAEGAISKVPFFVRKRVRKRVEEEASRCGSREVTMEHVLTCKRRFISNMEEEVKGYRVEACFGPAGCPNRAVSENDLEKRLEELLSAKNIKSFLKQKVGGGLKMHHEFQVTISDCPNACSRPQIADIGIIGARGPGLSDIPCSQCGACVKVCREDAVTMKGDGPQIDFDKCLSCGQCVGACPTGTIRESQKGYRILVGGKLGRHPQLGRELGAIFTKDAVLRIVDCCVDYYKAHNMAGERLGEVIDRAGMAELHTVCLQDMIEIKGTRVS